MWKWFYETSALLDLPIVAMAFFAVTFTIVVARALLGRRTTDDDTYTARLPLLDDGQRVYEPRPDSLGGRHG